MIVFQDGFAQYNNIAAFSTQKGGAWDNALPSTFSVNSAYAGGPEITRVGSGFRDVMIARLWQQYDHIALSFIMKTGSSTGGSILRIGLIDESTAQRYEANGSGSGGPRMSVEFSTSTGAGPQISHNVNTAAAPSNNVNSLVLSSSVENLQPSQHYHVQMLVDMRTPAACSVVVYINGVQHLSGTFNRDRLNNTFQMLKMSAIALTAYNATGTNITSIAFGKKVAVSGLDRHDTETEMAGESSLGREFFMGLELPVLDAFANFLVEEQVEGFLAVRF